IISSAQSSVENTSTNSYIDVSKPSFWMYALISAGFYFDSATQTAKTTTTTTTTTTNIQYTILVLKLKK
ncbi:MAG: hypothetical protein ACI8RD_002121, partial [Bacillariaceae sp.]